MRDLIDLVEDLSAFQVDFIDAKTIDDYENLSVILDVLVTEMCKHFGMNPKMLRDAKRRRKAA